VIERANDSDYGLNFSVWAGDTKRGRKIATQLQAGTVNVNEGYVSAWASVDAPMGGMKASGMGRRHGAEGIQKYTEVQTVAVQRGWLIAPPPGVSQRMFGKGMVLGLKALRRMPFIK
jgi:succinate-semialdehyde dehydrogenase/glutarate-semialdehyde dehydrogenase